MKYPDLYAVLSNEFKAQEFFQRLPDYVQEQIKTRANQVNSFESLQDYAQNLLRND